MEHLDEKIMKEVARETGLALGGVVIGGAIGAGIAYACTGEADSSLISGILLGGFFGGIALNCLYDSISRKRKGSGD